MYRISLLTLLLCLAWPAAAQIPAGFVDMGEFLADVQIEARYAGHGNFIGVPIDGYQAEKVLLTQETADALLAVQLELRQVGMGLKLFDGYRPQRAVDHFVRWAQDPEDETMKSVYYPHVDKSELFAQGYIADRLAGLLRSRGLVDVLIDTGEIKALGHRADGEPWRAGIALPDGTPVARTMLSDRALATSAPLATLLDPRRGAGHILDPRTGEPAARWRLASVSAPRAALADALSTAFCLMDRRAIDRALAYHPRATLEALVS